MLTLGHRFCGLLLCFVATSMAAELATTRTVEVSVVTDWETVSYYTSIEEIESKISSDFAHANNIFSSQMNIEIKVVHVDIPATEADDTIANHTHAGFLSESLIDYRNENPNHYNADVTILLTQRDLTTGSRNLIGYVYRIGSMCSSLAVAIVELADNGLDYLTVAHEIGHVLGGTHDGDPPCENETRTGWLMSSSVWQGSQFLSQCSIDRINARIDANGGCLFEDNVPPTPPITPPPPVTDQPFGGSGGGSMDIMFLLILFIMVVITTLSTRTDLNARRAQRRNNVFCKPKMSTGNSRRRTRH